MTHFELLITLFYISFALLSIVDTLDDDDGDEDHGFLDIWTVIKVFSFYWPFVVAVSGFCGDGDVKNERSWKREEE